MVSVAVLKKQQENAEHYARQRIIHEVPELLLINYEGLKPKVTDKWYHITITTQLNFKDPVLYRRELYSFLKRIGYLGNLIGAMEWYPSSDKWSRKDGLHFHVLSHIGTPPKDNMNNMFHFHIVPVSIYRPDFSLWSLEKVIDYIVKDVEYSQFKVDMEEQRIARAEWCEAN